MLLLALGLGAADWLVVGVYVAVLVGAGVWVQVRRGRVDAKDYFLAGGRIPVFAVAISTLATAQSAATFVGVPEDTYRGNLTYLSANIGGVLAAILLAKYFIPAYYRLGVSTPYQLLESRFGPGAKVAGSVTYLVGRVFASGARVYVGALPVSFAFFGDRSPQHLAIVIAAFMLFAVLYTLWGGLESVIWTDILQVGVYMGAALVAVVLIFRAIPADASEILTALQGGGGGGTSKLKVFEPGFTTSPWRIDFALPFTMLTAVTGWTLLNMAAFGTDQDLVQRLLTCKDAKSGGRSIIASILIGVPAVLLFSVIGLLLWVYYNAPQGHLGTAAGANDPGDAADLFLRFAMNQGTPGFAGLVLAGVLAAGPAGINASLNSMSSTFVNDLYRPLLARGRSDRHYVGAARTSVAAFGLVLGGFALLCAWWQPRSNENLLTFVLGVMGFAYAGLLGVFLTALFTRRGSAASAIAALVTGFACVLALQPFAVTWISEHLGVNLPLVANPWRIVVGTCLATGVCAAFRGRRAMATP